MPSATLRIDARKLNDVGKAMRQLSSGQIKTAIRQSLNRTGAAAYKSVVIMVQKESGLKAQKHVKRFFIQHRATAKMGGLVYSVSPRSGKRNGLPLKNLKPKQVAAGIQYTYAGKTYLRKSAFLIKKHKGHVFKRVGRRRFPVALQVHNINLDEMLSTPAVKAVFNTTTRTSWAHHWPSRLNEQVRRVKVRNRL